MGAAPMKEKGTRSSIRFCVVKDCFEVLEKVKKSTDDMVAAPVKEKWTRSSIRFHVS